MKSKIILSIILLSFITSVHGISPSDEEMFEENLMPLNSKLKVELSSDLKEKVLKENKSMRYAFKLLGKTLKTKIDHVLPKTAYEGSDFIITMQVLTTY